MFDRGGGGSGEWLRWRKGVCVVAVEQRLLE